MRRVLLASALVAAVLGTYLPSLGGGFLWNDSDYVTAPPLQPLPGLKRIWFEIGATQQYYPVLHTAFWAEHRLWGDSPAGYRVANALLHALAALLFVAVLRRLAVPGAWLAGFLFALHPVAVESVAWISEQKNTLSTVFYLGAALAYLRFEAIRRGQAEKVDRAGQSSASLPAPKSQVNFFSLTPSYCFATGLFLLALFSKSVTATLPAALLVALWWRNGRLEWRAALPLLPWFAAAAAGGAFTAWVERTYVGASGAEFALGPLARLQVAGRVVWFYLGKLLWPARLNFFYPRWAPNPGDPAAYAGTAAAAASLAALFAGRRRWRGTLAASLLFVGTLLPVLGFFNVYAFRFSFVADHFQYLACLGVLAWTGAAWSRWRAAAPLPASAAGAAALVALGLLTWRQCAMYREPAGFYRAILERNPSAWIAHNNLAILLEGRGEIGEAAEHFTEAARLKPDLAEAREGLGICLSRQGRLPEATVQFEQAVRLEPDNARSRENLGVTLARAGRLDDALREHERALALKADYPEAHNNLGIVLAELGRPAEARAQFEEALRLRPGYPEAARNLAALEGR